MSEPTKSGDKPITEEQITDDETTKALEEQAATEAEIAESHLLPESSADEMTREEYDRVGKGENYQPKEWQGTRPDDRTFSSTDVTAVDRSGQARLQKARGSGQDREPQGKPKQVEAPKP